MFEIIATNDFANVLCDVPLKYLPLLTQSFVSVKRIEDQQIVCDDSSTFLVELLEQLKNQELE